MNRFVSITLAAATAAILLAETHSASAQEVVKFGVQPATHPIYIAREMGLLAPIEKKHNVKFEWPKFSYGAPENQALAANEIQMASAGMGPAIVAAARLPAKLLAITVLEQTAILVHADSPIKSVAELKGQAIAHPGKGSQQYPLMVKALAEDRQLSVWTGYEETPSQELVYPFLKTDPRIPGNSRLVPQYPATYAAVAAPFYAVAGVRGLFYVNLLAFFATVWLTMAIDK